MSEPAAPVAQPRGARAEWLTRRERGGVLAIRLTVFLVTFFGRTVTRLVARVVALYYLLTSPAARGGLRAFYRRLDGREASLATLYRHFLRFVFSTVDAFFLAAGKTKGFEVTRTGHEHLDALRQGQKGAILLGAHVGSFYAMRIQGEQEGLKLHALMFTKNARMLNDALAKLDPEGAARVLELDPEGGVDSMLRVKELLDAGALVAVLGDRIPAHSAEGRVVRVPFLGADAAFPTGPLLLAATLKVPVYLTFGLGRGSRTYDLFCEPFAERIELPRGRRQEALAEWVKKYAERLESYVRRSPENWFNFYDFWR
jgi:predicted LPLAT superfamily acyltransferase